jgi:predicted nucleotide-binding protein (sugar kinase/HSP70/actin superfamily)
VYWLIIGIPRALLYYRYGHLWEKTLRECGFEVVVSSATDHQIKTAGSRAAIDEVCLPVKIFLGHALDLASKVDWIMVPHLIKVEPGAYICPKFMGLPDLVCHALPGLRSKLLVMKLGPETEMSRSLRQWSQGTGMVQRSSLRKITDRNLLEPPALSLLKPYRFVGAHRLQSTLTIGLLGHPYCLYDAGFNLDLLQILAGNEVNIVTPEMMPSSEKGAGSGKLNKKLFWTLGKSQFDALEWMLNGESYQVDGFIQVTPFACGPEAIVGDLLERRIREAKKPILKLYFDELSGEAGIMTRLEAFLDLLKYRCSAC